MNRDHGGAIWFSLCSLEQVDFRGDPGFSQVGGALIPAAVSRQQAELLGH